jgi:hypothetical protein
LRKLTQGPAVKIGRPPPPAAPRSGRRKRPVVPPKVAGQDSACKCGAGVFDATPPENLTQVFRSWRPRIASTNKRQADLEALCQQIEAGHLTPVVGKTYPLAEVPKAIRHLERGHAQGKIAITI